MIELISQPWPWYVAGPLIGLMVPLLLIIGGKRLGISANLHHMCAAIGTANIEFLRHDWKKGFWNLTFALGIMIGGFVGVTLLASPDPAIDLAPATVEALRNLGVEDLTGLLPADLFSWTGLASVPGFLLIVGGGFLVGFGARYAGGCTSGHAITGLADLQLPSLVAVLGFFAGGLLVTHVLLPLLL